MTNQTQTEDEQPFDQTPLTEDELTDLHECIVGTNVPKDSDCFMSGNEGQIKVSCPVNQRTVAVSLDSLPEYVRYYELVPAQREAQEIANEIAHTIDPDLNDVPY